MTLVKYNYRQLGDFPQRFDSSLTHHSTCSAPYIRFMYRFSSLVTPTSKPGVPNSFLVSIFCPQFSFYAISTFPFQNERLIWTSTVMISFIGATRWGCTTITTKRNPEWFVLPVHNSLSCLNKKKIKDFLQKERSSEQQYDRSKVVSFSYVKEAHSLDSEQKIPPSVVVVGSEERNVPVSKSMREREKKNRMTEHNTVFNSMRDRCIVCVVPSKPQNSLMGAYFSPTRTSEKMHIGETRFFDPSWTHAEDRTLFLIQKKYISYPSRSVLSPKQTFLVEPEASPSWDSQEDIESSAMLNEGNSDGTSFLDLTQSEPVRPSFPANLSTEKKIEKHSRDIYDICKTKPNIAAKEVLAQLTSLQSIRVVGLRDITSAVVKNLVLSIYCSAYIGLPPDVLSSWIMWALLQGANYLNARDLARLSFALSHYGKHKELAMFSAHVMRLRSEFSPLQARNTLQCYAECGLLLSCPVVITTIGYHARLSNVDSMRLFNILGTESGVFSLMLPLIKNRTEGGISSLLLAVHALFSTKWTLSSTIEVQDGVNPSETAERLTLGVIKGIFRSILTKPSTIPSDDMICGVNLLLVRRSALSFPMLQGLITVCLSHGHFQRARIYLTQKSISLLLRQKMFHTVLAIISSTADTSVQDSMISHLLQQLEQPSNIGLMLGEKASMEITEGRPVSDPCNRNTQIDASTMSEKTSGGKAELLITTQEVMECVNAIVQGLGGLRHVIGRPFLPRLLTFYGIMRATKSFSELLNWMEKETQEWNLEVLVEARNENNLTPSKKKEETSVENDTSPVSTLSTVTLGGEASKEVTSTQEHVEDEKVEKNTKMTLKKSSTAEVYFILLITLLKRLALSPSIRVRLHNFARSLLSYIDASQGSMTLVIILIHFLKVKDIHAHSRLIHDIQKNIKEKRNPDENKTLFCALASRDPLVLPLMFRVRQALLLGLPLKFLNLEFSSFRVSEKEYHEVLRSRESELFFQHIIPLITQRDPSHFLPYTTLNSFILQATKKETPTPRMVLEIILAFGRRERFNESWILAHVHLLRKLDKDLVQDSLHMMFMLSRNATNARLFSKVSKILIPLFFTWINAGIFSLNQITFFIRSMYLQGKCDSPKLAMSICDELTKEGLHRLENDFQTQYTYAYVVFGTQLLPHYPQLGKLITHHGYSRTIITLAQLSDQYSFSLSSGLREACIQRLKCINHSPKEISLLLQCRNVLEESSNTSLTKQMDSLVLSVPPEEYDSKTFTEVSLQLIRRGEVSEDLRTYFVRVFLNLDLDETNIGNAIYNLSRMEGDVVKVSHSVASILQRPNTPPSAQQLGLVLKSYTKVEEIPLCIVEATQPLLQCLLPGMNAMEFTLFAFPLLKYDGLPQEIGSELCNAVRQKLSHLNAAQASRLSSVVGQSYCHDGALRNDLRDRIVPGVHMLRFQEAVGLLSNIYVQGDTELQKVLHDRLNLLCQESNTMDQIWAIQCLSKSTQRSEISLFLRRVEQLAPTMNSYEVSMILSTLASAGITNVGRIIQALTSRLETLSGEQFKGNMLLTLMNHLLRTESDIEFCIHKLLRILLQKFEIDAYFLVQILEFAHRLENITGIIAHEVHHYALKFSQNSAKPEEVMHVLGTAVKQLPQGLITHIEPLLKQNASKIPERGLIHILKNHPHLGKYFLEIHQSQAEIYTDMNGLVSLVYATNREPENIQSSTLRQLLFTNIETILRESQHQGSVSSPNEYFSPEKLCEGNRSTPRPDIGSRPLSLSPTAAVMILSAYDGTCFVNLLHTAQETLSVRYAIYQVPPHLCAEALHNVSRQRERHPSFTTLVDPILNVLATRVLDKIETYSLPQITDLLVALQDLDIDDEHIIVRLFRKVYDLKDMILTHPELPRVLLRCAEYFSPHLFPRAYMMLQRLQSIPHLF